MPWCSAHAIAYKAGHCCGNSIGSLERSEEKGTGPLRPLRNQAICRAGEAQSFFRTLLTFSGSMLREFSCSGAVCFLPAR
jgi:hypothetical protein